jgi:hypothetical protein
MSVPALRSPAPAPSSALRQIGPLAPKAPGAGPVRRRRKQITLFLPISPLLAAIGPAAFLLSPPARGLPVRQKLKAAAAVGATLFALSGMDIAIDSPQALIRIRIL